MAVILKKEQLSEQVFRYRLSAPRIAAKRRAGQFVILRPVQNSERIPLTIVDADPEAGWIEIIFQVVGRTTMILSALRPGDSIRDLAGPLGKPTHIQNYGRCLCIGGGVGAAPLYPVIKALHAAGNEIFSIIGARTGNLIILEQEIRSQSSRLLVATDDGSYGKKGFVTDAFKDLAAAGERFDVAFVIGPVVMMKVTCGMTVSSGIRTFASLNPIMIDGTGMCGGCRVTVNGETRFACVDGPEFDAAAIDWNELVKRLNGYRKFETAAREAHACRLEGVQE